MTTEDAQKALDDFWEMVEKKYGPSHSRIDDEDRRKLYDLEKQFSQAEKSDAARIDPSGVEIYSVILGSKK
jgi:hypothetical protein